MAQPSSPPGPPARRGQGHATCLVVWGEWHLPALLIGLTYPGQRLWAALLVFAANILLLSFAFTWLYLASWGSPFVAAVSTRRSTLWEDTFITPAHPERNPLIVCGAGLMTAALMLVILVFWFRIFDGPPQPATAADLLAPKRKD